MSDEKPKLHSAAEDTEVRHVPDIVEAPVDDYFDGVKDEPLTLMGMARDPFERLILEETQWLHNQADDYRRMAQRPQLPFDDSCIQKLIQCSNAVVRLHETFRKHRGRGEQKIIVERRTGPATAERAKRDLRRAAPRMNAKRHDGKASVG